MTSSAKTVHIIGGGLAGSEAAWQLASAGVPVVLHEMRPVRGTEAHLTENLAELVCSNSFRSDDAVNNAVGLLHEEMRRPLPGAGRGDPQGERRGVARLLRRHRAHRPSREHRSLDRLETVALRQGRAG